MIMKFFKILILLLVITNFTTSCRKTRGCTDPEALNYNPDASKDDHSCYFFWVGQNYGGGKVFYVDQTGKHGLISAEFYLPANPWGCSGINVSGAEGTFVGTGAQNTLDIVNGCGPNTAASDCYNLDTLGFDDWYLPSLEELKGLAETLGKMGQANLNGPYHLTSTEKDSLYVWTVYMPNHSVVSVGKDALGMVRPIRSF